MLRRTKNFLIRIYCQRLRENLKNIQRLQIIYDFTRMSNHYPIPIKELSQSLSGLPGIGRRTSERLTLALLDWESDQLKELGELISTLKEKVTYCEICANLADKQSCDICLDPRRNGEVICVVEYPQQIAVIDKCGRYNGLFHVLGGKIDPLANVHAENLRINQLLERIKNNTINEIILATSPDVEGEATAVYLANELREQFQLNISRIALGIPVGSDLTFADSATMAMAIDSRRVIQ